ncbi:hypothetical protein Sked_14330 [Sanguibacter keddieii DSM 10542]|uniref:DNA-binding protein n=1 Tax=Sanguibacter keddieii (strain ATCC 51767 / DSM 10542 / NCFB 3025 / ST-74) TaxID=446469 RepID=D1BF73_SANKS|nr:helix-hairpin-helix domain-containing protein [Sanguibacter keddieii]ACZ21369.1 hypothetical protein Sked_14330 [Sanguibacter keddieii DSM 10542]
MTSEPAGPETSELTPRIGKVARRELAVHGITTYEQLAARSTRELLGIHGVGPKAVRILAEELDGLGLAFAGG